MVAKPLHNHKLICHFHTPSLQDGYCQLNNTRCGVEISDFHVVQHGNVSALVMAIAEKGPIGVAIDASHKSFSFYSHGVYYEPHCGECYLTHVLHRNVSYVLMSLTGHNLISVGPISIILLYSESP